MKERILSGLMAMLMLIAVMSPMQANAETDKGGVKISNVDYGVELDNTRFVYICNQETIGSKVGTEYYMTYTVESMAMDEAEHQGVCGTSVPMQTVPWEANGEGGGFYYCNYTTENIMLVQKRTYFLKFVVTEDGFTYRVGWAKSDKSRYVDYDMTMGEVKTNLGYFGLFIAGTNMTGKLTKIRCYDRYGNDLGVQVTPDRNAIVTKNLSNGQHVNHSYRIVLDDAQDVFIANKKAAQTKKMYMEYTVESSDSSVFQTGVIQSSTIHAFPFNGMDAVLFYRQEMDVEKMGQKENGVLLQPGAKYIIEFTMSEEGMTVIAQRTMNGETVYLSFPTEYGACSPTARMFGLFFGQGEKTYVNCILKDFKCYDAKNNNLGVQCNQLADITHYGNMEDYSGCEAVYYCDEDKSLYALYADQKVKHTANGETKNGTYAVNEATSKISIKIDGKKEEFDYLYQYFTNAEGKKWRRLHVYRVNFETGTDEVIEEQVLFADSGYVVLRPEDPVWEGNEFLGWYTGNGKEYDFEQLVTESFTLYAKWNEYTYADEVVEEKMVIDHTKTIVLVVSALFLVASITISAVIIKKRGGAKNENRQK